MVGSCAIPLGLILVGAVIADYVGNFQEDWRWPVLASSCVLRLGLIPVVMYVLARHIPAAVELKRVILLQAAMPAAVFPILMAKLYDGDAKTATRVVIATSAVSIVTLPLWIRYGAQIIGL
jgi:predicted permease